MSASLIGRLGSSAFRLSITTVSMSLTGSCFFSSESAPGPFHHGIRRRGGTIFGAALPLDKRQVQADIRSHLIHRPARDADMCGATRNVRFVPIADMMGRYPALLWRTHSAQVDRSISKRSESFAYHFWPCIPPISFNSGVSTKPRSAFITN